MPEDHQRKIRSVCVLVSPEELCANSICRLYCQTAETKQTFKLSRMNCSGVLALSP